MEMSRRFIKVLVEFVTPSRTRNLFIDECFLDLTAYASNCDLTAYAHLIPWIGSHVG